MNILILDEHNWLEQKPEIKSLVENVVKATLEHEEFPLNVEVSITLTNNELIKEINSEYRGIDKVTDVLSFPQIEWIEDEINLKEYENLVTGDIILGDIVISVERAIEQAIEYGHSFDREIGFLTAHSMFHLLGYDHMEEDDELEMVKKQESVLQMIGLIR